MQITPRQALNLAIWTYAAVHLLVAALLPLAAHEAHYALYARDLQLSYLDHPPLAAWLQSLILAFSTADFALRLMPIGLSVLAQFLLASLARTVYPEGSRWLAVVSVLILQGTLVFHGSMTLTPDAPLIVLGLVVVMVTIRCVERGQWSDWLLLGLAIGLAGLSKYTSVTLAISIVLIMLARNGWRGLFRPGLWLAGSVALVVIGPVLWWNWQQDWATVQFHADYQFEDIQRWSPLGFLRSTAEQFLYYSPLLVLGGVAVLWQLARTIDWRIGDTRRDLLVALFVVPVLAVYLLTALESRASPHWSMLGWVLLIPLLAHWLIERWHASYLIRIVASLSAVYSITLLVVLLVLALPIGRWPDFSHPARLVADWQSAAIHGDRLRKTLAARGFTTEPVLLARNWHHARLLSWYLPDAPVRNLFTDINPPNLQHGVADHQTWGVLVYPRSDRQPRLDNLTRDFDCTPVDSRPAYFGESLVQVFHYYACYSKIPAPVQ